MKKLKLYISVVLITIIAITIIICLYASVEYAKQKKEEYRRNYIKELIETEIDASSMNKEPIKNPDPELNLDDIISGSINESKVDSVFTNISMINSSTFKAMINGSEKTYRLIGVDGRGDPEVVKKILQDLTKVVITYDLLKFKKGETIEQIYLWNGDDKDINNMINLQIVRNGICKTTYEGTSYYEHPNVKYSTQFVKASKEYKN